jgi:hypothetical protein
MAHAPRILRELAELWEPKLSKKRFARRKHPPDRAGWKRSAVALERGAANITSLAKLGWSLGEELSTALAVARAPDLESEPGALREVWIVTMGLSAAHAAVALAYAAGETPEASPFERASMFATKAVSCGGATHAYRALSALSAIEDSARIRAMVAETNEAGEDEALAELATLLESRASPRR